MVFCGCEFWLFFVDYFVVVDLYVCDVVVCYVECVVVGFWNVECVGLVDCIVCCIYFF